MTQGHPIQLFLEWYREAEEKKVVEFNAMNLATVNKFNQPSVRVVYCKEASERGLSFYTNYRGEKAREIQNNPIVCVNFFWPELMRQVRIRGKVTQLTRQENEQYFATRDRSSQIGAWASQQSEPMADMTQLLKRVDEFEAQFSGQVVPCPEHWGGFLLRPDYVELWQGKPGRLHERRCFNLSSGQWESFLRYP